MKKLITLLTLGLIGITEAAAFCGFYVAKADADLFNESSQVIMVRNGNKTTITMSNDFQGDVKDFAMVVPVPVVLQESDIRTVRQALFDMFGAYSAPRMAEYYDSNPCMNFDYELDDMMAVPSSASREEVMSEAVEEDPYGVSIEAEYAIGEYDILILSAKESTGLKKWLVDNGYKIPSKAEEVLEPYIKSDMKFFVVKVNLDRMESNGFSNLNPLQISFESDKFMLPIRLGMANSKGTQDMIVYAFTKTGRLETTNYRTLKLPTDIDVPTFVEAQFGDFYKDVFSMAYRKNGKNGVFLEYAWDLSSSNYVHCDPCSSTPPMLADMKEAGVDWLSDQRQGTSEYTGDAFFTRMHVRYDRENFPQDLLFQETPNKEQYQCRYVMHHPATGDLDCKEGRQYMQQLAKRRKKELENLRRVAGWTSDRYKAYAGDYRASMRGMDADPEHTVGTDINTDVNNNNETTEEPRTAAGNDSTTLDTFHYDPVIGEIPTMPEEYDPEGGEPMSSWWYILIGAGAIAGTVVLIKVFSKKKTPPSNSRMS